MQTTLRIVGATPAGARRPKRGCAGGLRCEPLRGAEPLKCLTFFQDDQTGLRARLILRDLTQNALGSRLKAVELSFDLIDSWGSWQIALGENRQSAMVLISARDAGCVPAEIISTLTYWVGLKEDLPRWVIIAFDPVAESPVRLDPNFEFLQTLAEQVHVEMRVLHGDGPHVELVPLIFSLRQWTKVIPDRCERGPVRARPGQLAGAGA